MPSTDIAPQVVEETIADAIVQLGVSRADVKRNAVFEDLDVDSLDLVEIAQVAEETWGVKLNPQDFTDVKTVGDAIDLVMANLS